MVRYVVRCHRCTGPEVACDELRDDPRVVHSYEPHEYATTVTVVGAGLAAATEWLNALSAGAEVVSVRRRDPTAHTELLAINRALQKVREDRLPFATLYVTLEPCAQCAGAIVLAKVGRVVFGAQDLRCGMAGSVYDLLRHPRLNHRPEVVGGLMADECADLLKRFFESKRLA